jgi:uncharacterized protein YndB with AHSA1/START domain
MTSKTSAPAAVAKPSDREIVITRVFDAPRALVFEAWTRPEHVAAWWGPRGFTLASCEIDLRPGGAYRFVMRSPDGQDYPIKGVYREVVPPERIVYTDDFDMEGMPNIEGVVTLTFAEQGDKTMLTMSFLYETAADCETMVKMQMVEGMSETLDRLAERLETLQGLALKGVS